MRIGNVDLASNLLLAPIAGYCDLGFRTAIRPLGGLGLACTDLICPRGLLEQSRNTLRLIATNEQDRPLCVQLYGVDVAEMCEAARRMVDHGAAVIDINMGCPVDKVTKKNGGAAWLCDPFGAVKLAEAVVRAVPVPVTVKVRLGPDDDHIIAPQMAPRFREAGVAAMTVHGRTTAQRFKGRVNLDGIAAVVSAAAPMPVFGNGDLETPEAAATMIRRTGCAGVMIGRGALADPWLFRDTDAYLRTGRIPVPPTREHRLAFMMRHFNAMHEFEGERRACHMMRQRISWYAKHLGPCRQLREQVRTVQSAKDFHEAVDRFLVGSGESLLAAV